MTNTEYTEDGAVRIKLNSEHLRMLGASEEDIAKAEEEERTAQPSVVTETQAAPSNNTQTVPNVKEEEKQVNTKTEDKVTTKSSEDTVVPPKPSPEELYKRELDLIENATSYITDPEERKLVDEELANVIRDKYESYKDKSPEERIEILTSIAEKKVRKMLKEKEKAAEEERKRAEDTEESRRKLKEVTTFAPQSAAAPTTADMEKELYRRAENGDEKALYQLLEMRRTYSI